MAAYAALVSLLNNIEQMMSHPRLSISFHNNQIQSLQEKAALLLDFIEGGYNNYSGGSEEALDLESHIASAAFTAEDMIESHLVNQILPLSADDGETAFSFSLYLQNKMAIEEKNAPTEDMIESHIVNQTAFSLSLYLQKKMTGVKKMIRSLYKKKSARCSHYLQQIIEDMDAIVEKANELKDKHKSREEQPTHSTPLTETGEETAMVGFDDELLQLLDELTSHRSNRHIISVVGMGGMGKTTLAKNIYAHQLIIEHFDIRAWATVSQQYNAKEILAQLLSSLGSKGDSGEQLHKTLFGRRYLIILDDIWSVEAWEEVSCFFPDNGNGSRIVLTTRLSDVANNCSSSCLQKNLLDENRSWELFCRKAFQHEDCPTELVKTGKEIVKLCKGLPLSIVVIGGRLLKSPRTLEYWENVAKDIESIPNSKEKQECLDVLFSSYNHLPPHLKPCFLHIGVLKGTNYERLHISRIIQLWVAEGFLKSNGGRVLEEIAEDYLKDLIRRNLILVGRRRKNGKMKSCEIHDLLRDLCLKVAEQQGLFHVTQGRVLGPARTPLTRSIMDYGFRMEQSSDKHRLLRILHVHRYMSLEEAFGCVNLRYLAYKNFAPETVRKLPSSVSLVWNLQTLILWERKWRAVAPTEIWKMLQLRHIECCQVYLPHPDGQDELLILENFQTLKNAVNFRLSKDVCKIIPNIKKLNLVYGRELQGYDDCLIECLCNLNRLHKLESLKLIADSRWLHLDYEMNEILTFPSSLNKLSLRLCGLHWDDLKMIGSLPLLEVLNLELNSVSKGSQWSPVNGQFQRLKFLKIRYCTPLRCWNADSCHFPILENLILCGLWYLEEIPWGIGEIPTLKHIEVNECSNSATISALKIKEEQLQCQENDDLQIQVYVRKCDQESFMAMVETEGLTLNNVKFNIF